MATIRFIVLLCVHHINVIKYFRVNTLKVERKLNHNLKSTTKSYPLTMVYLFQFISPILYSNHAIMA